MYNVINIILGVGHMTQINKKAIVLEQMDIPYQSALEPFIYTDILAEYAGDYQTNCFHFWTMDNQVILGMQDTRVTDLSKGILSIVNNNYHPVVRNSGGLAVVADKGVLNFSMIIPQPEEKSSFSIDDGYKLMKQLIERALADFNCQIDAFEVHDSYCPGEFDLSINGKKFAGISQRRIKKGIGIMIYLSVNGDQKARGELVKEFYQVSLGDKFGQEKFPPVNPDSMANLTDLLKADFSVEELTLRLIKALEEHYTFETQQQKNFDAFLSSNDFNERFTHQESRMKQRNEIINWEELIK